MTEDLFTRRVFSRCFCPKQLAISFSRVNEQVAVGHRRVYIAFGSYVNVATILERLEIEDWPVNKYK